MFHVYARIFPNFRIFARIDMKHKHRGKVHTWNSSDTLPPLLFQIEDRYERYNQWGLHHPPTGVSAMLTFPLFNVVLGADLSNFGKDFAAEFDFGADFGAAFSNFGGDFDNFGDFFGSSVSVEWDDVSWASSASGRSPLRC